MARYPVPAIGQRFTADFVASMLPDFVIKTADTTRPNTIAMANDPELVTPTLDINGVYEVELFANISGLQIAGFRIDWTVPAGATGFRRCLGSSETAATSGTGIASDMKWNVQGYGTAVQYGTHKNAVGQLVWVYETTLLTMGATAGTVQIRTAQSTANVTGSVIHAGSYIKYRRVG